MCTVVLPLHTHEHERTRTHRYVNYALNQPTTPTTPKQPALEPKEPSPLAPEPLDKVPAASPPAASRNTSWQRKVSTVGDSKNMQTMFQVFMMVCSAGRTDLVEELLKKRKELINKTDEHDGFTPLMRAAKGGHTSLVYEMLRGEWHAGPNLPTLTLTRPKR